MANLDFYATREDLTNLFNFIYTETDCRVMESYSDLGANLREFASLDKLFSVYEFKYKDYKQGYLLLLQLWSPTVSSQVRIKRLSLDARKCNGHDFRYRVDGWGLMQLYLGTDKNGIITVSHFGHNSLKRAQKWESISQDELGLVADWNWDLLMKISRKIQYHIRKRLAVSNFGSRPILQEANKKLAEGYSLRN